MSYTSPKYTHVSRQPAISKFQDEMASIFKDKRENLNQRNAS